MKGGVPSRCLSHARRRTDHGTQKQKAKARHTSEREAARGRVGAARRTTVLGSPTSPVALPVVAQEWHTLGWTKTSKASQDDKEGMGNMNLPIGVDDTAPSDVVGQARAGALPGRSAMKYSIVTAGVCAAFVGTDAFVPSVPAIGSLRAPPAVASMQSVQPVRDTEMTMALGGSKSRQVPKSDSSRLSNIFRGSRGKG